jgi:hypothetical protein
MTDERTNQKLINRLRDLVLWARYGDYITCHFGTGKVDLAVPFLFKLVDLTHASNEFSMVQAIDDDGLRDEFGILDNTMAS